MKMATKADLERMIASGQDLAQGQIGDTRVVTSLTNLQDPTALGLIREYGISEMSTLVEGAKLATAEDADRRLARAAATGNIRQDEVLQVYGAAAVVYAEGALETTVAKKEGRTPRAVVFSARGGSEFSIAGRRGNVNQSLSTIAQYKAQNFGKA
jgi:hypothetical protein